jgi:hypothetical protein
MGAPGRKGDTRGIQNMGLDKHMHGGCDPSGGCSVLPPAVFLVRPSDSLFLAPQSGLEKKENAI